MTQSHKILPCTCVLQNRPGSKVSVSQKNIICHCPLVKWDETLYNGRITRITWPEPWLERFGVCKNDQLQFESSMFSQFSQFNQFSKKTQNLTFIDIKYVLYHNKCFFLYKKGLFCNKYQEIILDFSNLHLKKCNLSKAKITYFRQRLLFLGEDYIFWAKITKNKHLWQHNGPKWLNWLY